MNFSSMEIWESVWHFFGYDTEGHASAYDIIPEDPVSCDYIWGWYWYFWVISQGEEPKINETLGRNPEARKMGFLDAQFKDEDYKNQPR